jgi:hypothetical protein
MFQALPKLDPQLFLQDFRENYTNLYKLWTTTQSIPEGVVLKTPQEQPIAKLLPPGIREEFELTDKARAKQKLTWLKYMRIMDGRIHTVIEDTADLPDDEHLLVVSQTLTLNTSTTTTVITDIFVARKG